MSRSYWTSYGICQSWLSVPVGLGFLFELTGSLFSGLATALIFDYELITRLNVHYRILLSSSITMTLVVISFHHTGGFFQPLLAFARTFGCIGVLREVSILDHIIVYWLGASIGAILAMYSAQFLKKIFTKLKTSRKNSSLKYFKLQKESGSEDDTILFQHVEIK